MSTRSLLPEAVETYVRDMGARETEVQKRLRAETATVRFSGMQIGPDEGALLALLVRLLGARRTLEIGTYTGYSALAVALALPADGRIVCCDVSDEWTQIARRYWREAHVADRIDLRLAPASETLADLIADPGPDSFDFAFIDADKEGYDDYYERCLALVRSGGLIALDNTLWSGRVAAQSDNDADTVALRKINRKIRDDPRVDFCLLTVGDGVTLARRR